MKRAYNIYFALLCVIVVFSFVPWLCSIVFPSESSDPFVTFSPISGTFVVSQNGGDNTQIFTVDSDGNPLQTGLTKNDRDSLVPQMYYNQLNARGVLPDSIAGKHIDVPSLKSAQWVFSSLPRDINRVEPGVYPIMESRPKRLDLEDPVEVFTLDGGKTEFINMASNTVNDERSRKFDDVFVSRGFRFPAISASANITAKKGYDEGYLLADSDGQVFHVKMQAGQPYMSKVNMPQGVKASHVFILENPDTRHIGLVTSTDGGLYAIEREGYKAVKLPVEGVYPERQRITILKNLFNWVIKLSDSTSSRWAAIDSDDYSLLGVYQPEKAEPSTITSKIFPFSITFTDIDDCYAYPRLK